MTPGTSSLTVGITTRDRPESLARCVRSLESAADLITEIIVYDDGSAEPAAAGLGGALAPALAGRLRVVRPDRHAGYIAGRNAIVREAAAPAVLLLDDDTRVLGRDSLVRGLETLGSSAAVAAVAFAQADADGRPWPAGMQAAPVSYACYVPSVIGFAHLVKRDVFNALGGYRELFYFYGEEKEFGLRLIDAGYAVVYLPDARVAHVPDLAGRDQRKYLRYVTRNDCLNAILNDPWSRLVWAVPGRLATYFRMRRAWRIHDPGGFTWILRELAGSLRGAWRVRRPVRRATLRRWKALRRDWPPFAVERGRP